MRFKTLLRHKALLLISLSITTLGWSQQLADTESVQLFELSSNRAVASQYLTPEHDGYLLELDQQKLQRFMNDAPSTFTLRLPSGNGKAAALDIQLMKSQIIAPGAIGKTSNGFQKIDLESQGTHYWGKVTGESTQVAISFFNNEIYGYFSGARGNFNLIPLKEEGVTTYAFYKDQATSEDLSCATDDSEDEATSDTPASKSSTVRTQRYPIRISLEANSEVLAASSIGNGSVAQTVNIMLSHFNQSAMIFSNEELTMWISEISIETIEPTDFPGPGMTNNGGNCPAGGTSNYMSQFQTLRSDNYNGDYAYLFVASSCRAAGRAATIGGFCDNPNTSRMGVGLIPQPLPSGYELPVVHPRLNIFIHEMGHLLGSPHTRSCIWNGNGTALDAGPNGDANNCYDGPQPAFYTFMASGGTPDQWQDYNYIRGFGVQPGQRIRDRVIEHLDCFTENIHCQANRYIFHRIADEFPVDYNAFYQALDIKADNKILNSATALYVASEYIELLPGFEVAINAEFEAIVVDDCLDYVDFTGQTENGTDKQVVSQPSFTIQVFPNPSTGQFSVQLDRKLKQLEYQILDLNGTSLRSGILNETDLFDVTVGRVRPGIYLLRVMSEGQIAVTKVVIY